MTARRTCTCAGTAPGYPQHEPGCGRPEGRTEIPGDIEWFTRSGHCGKCGQPGNFCPCTTADPCGCRDLHPMGSGREPDALEQFVEVAPDQDGLF